MANENCQSLESQGIVPGPADVTETALPPIIIEESENAEGKGLPNEGQKDEGNERQQENANEKGEVINANLN